MGIGSITWLPWWAIPPTSGKPSSVSIGNFTQPIRIKEMARELRMSVSGFHHHFKAVTATSPLQFQKHLRLQEARRLMLNEDLDAATAARRVGYRDPAYFNREYKSIFGVPPMRDVQRLREAAVENAGR
jgi:AraC-like DNA-binding protein